MGTVNERPKGAKPPHVPHPQGIRGIAEFLRMPPTWLEEDSKFAAQHILRVLSGIARDCRNCGASRFKQGKCEYCGSNQ